MNETQSGQSNTTRVLIVDDDQTNRELLRNMLRQLTTAELHVANDGRAGLELFREFLPKMVFLDIDMPELDGFALLDQIHAMDNSVFVVMVSGHGQVEAVQKATSQGAKGYIVKPYSAQRVFDAVHRYVSETNDHGFLRNP
ncbi:MAG TPA: response regulator [Burkholderiales bacterium]|nr:response regulator [Burkholderiales bacterium]